METSLVFFNKSSRSWEKLNFSNQTWFGERIGTFSDGVIGFPVSHIAVVEDPSSSSADGGGLATAKFDVKPPPGLFQDGDA